jgi:hypothetical protein
LFRLLDAQDCIHPHAKACGFLRSNLDIIWIIQSKHCLHFL